jgi:hypothetical protein
MQPISVKPWRKPARTKLPAHGRNFGRHLPDSELLENPYADFSDEEVRAEMIARFSDAFPELRIVRRPALIEKSKDL